MLVGAAGLLLHNIPLLLARAVRDGRPFDLLRADQIRHPAAAPRQATKCSAAPGWSRPAPISRILGGTLLGGMLVVQTPDGSFHAEWAALGGAARRAGRPGRRGSSCPLPRPTADAPPLEDGLAHRPRLDPAGQRDDAHPAPVPGDPRDQFLLGDGRGARRAIPAAGQECARRRPDRRDPVPGDLLDRRRDRLDRGQPAAQGPGLGALFARPRRW